MVGGRRVVTWRVMLVAWVLVIWAHSLVPGEASSSESGFVLGLVRPVFALLGLRDVRLMHLIVRKAGHFLEYLVLGAVASRVLRPRLRGDAWRLAALCALWAAVPMIDETIQLFTPGRVGAAGDVLIDMAGYATGTLAALVAHAVGRARG